MHGFLFYFPLRDNAHTLLFNPAWLDFPLLNLWQLILHTKKVKTKLVWNILNQMKIGTSAYAITGRRGKARPLDENVALEVEDIGPFFRVLLSNVPAFQFLGWGGGIYFDWCIPSLWQLRLSATLFDSFTILSLRNDPFRNIRSLHTPYFWVDLPRTVCGSVCLSVETSTSWKEGWAFITGLRYSPLHVTELCREISRPRPTKKCLSFPLTKFTRVFRVVNIVKHKNRIELWLQRPLLFYWSTAIVVKPSKT